MHVPVYSTQFQRHHPVLQFTKLSAPSVSMETVIIVFVFTSYYVCVCAGIPPVSRLNVH